MKRVRYAVAGVAPVIGALVAMPAGAQSAAGAGAAPVSAGGHGKKVSHLPAAHGLIRTPQSRSVFAHDCQPGSKEFTIPASSVTGYTVKAHGWRWISSDQICIATVDVSVWFAHDNCKSASISINTANYWLYKNKKNVCGNKSTWVPATFNINDEWRGEIPFTLCTGSTYENPPANCKTFIS